MSMSDDEQEKKMSELAKEAARKFYHQYEIGNKQINHHPEIYLQHSIPYLTVRTLERQEIALDRHEKALKSLEADSRSKS